MRGLNEVVLLGPLTRCVNVSTIIVSEFIILWQVGCSLQGFSHDFCVGGYEIYNSGAISPDPHIHFFQLPARHFHIGISTNAHITHI